MPQATPHRQVCETFTMAAGVARRALTSGAQCTAGHVPAQRVPASTTTNLRNRVHRAQDVVSHVVGCAPSGNGTLPRALRCTQSMRADLDWAHAGMAHRTHPLHLANGLGCDVHGNVGQATSGRQYGVVLVARCVVGLGHVPQGCNVAWRGSICPHPPHASQADGTHPILPPVHVVSAGVG